MAGLSSKLTRLVQAEDQPELYLYVCLRIGHNVPLDDSFFSKRIVKIQKKMLQKLFVHRLRGTDRPGLDKAVPGPVRDLIAQQRKVERLLDLTRLQEERELLETLVRRLLREKPEFLVEKLRDRNPAIRFLTIQAIARRRLPLEKALIERLGDPDRAVAQAARAALVRLGRGIDFGPPKKATPAQRQKATQRWSEWLVLQEKTSPPSRQGLAGSEALLRTSTE
jgi:hypothetical protein